MTLPIRPSISGPTTPTPLPDRAVPGLAAAARPATVSSGDSGVAFSSVAVLLAAFGDPATPVPAPLPASDSPTARELQTLLGRRLTALLAGIGLPGRAPPALDVDREGRVSVRERSAEGLALQEQVDRHPDVQALARLLHAIHGAPASPAELHRDPEAAALTPAPSKPARMRSARFTPGAFVLPPRAEPAASARVPPWVWAAVAVVGLLLWWM